MRISSDHGISMTEFLVASVCTVILAALAYGFVARIQNRSTTDTSLRDIQAALETASSALAKELRQLEPPTEDHPLSLAETSITFFRRNIRYRIEFVEDGGRILRSQTKDEETKTAVMAEKVDHFELSYFDADKNPMESLPLQLTAPGSLHSIEFFLKRSNQTHQERVFPRNF